MSEEPRVEKGKWDTEYHVFGENTRTLQSDRHDNIFHVTDGVYSLSKDTKVLYEGDEIDDDEVFKKFGSKQVFVCSAYETMCTIVLDKPPLIFKGKQIGSGFNYGSTNILETDMPVLILAEND
jgi:hypothetical protein